MGDDFDVCGLGDVVDADDEELEDGWPDGGDGGR